MFPFGKNVLMPDLEKQKEAEGALNCKDFVTSSEPSMNFWPTTPRHISVDRNLTKVEQLETISKHLNVSIARTFAGA
jgi:hypothetical protein